MSDGPSGFTKAHYEECRELYQELELENNYETIDNTNRAIGDWYRSGSLNFVPEPY
jgi:hypothetical protein